jgi:hypothetical protein
MKRRLFLLALSAVALALPAGASTFIFTPQRDLVRDAAAIVQGRVLSTSSFWNETGQVIVTEAVFQVEERLVGKAPSVVVVRTFGGRVGNFVVEASGFPTFRKGERQLLFLEAEKGGHNRVLGYQQGQFRIERDASGAELARPAVDHGATFVGQSAPIKTLSLAALKSSILRDARALGRATAN